MKRILSLLAAGWRTLCGGGMGNWQESEIFKAEKIKAEQGDAESQFNLGDMYNTGWGVPKNFIESYAWYLLAKANGQEKASEMVPILEKRLTAEQKKKGKAGAAELHRLIERKSAE